MKKKYFVILIVIFYASFLFANNSDISYTDELKNDTVDLFTSPGFYFLTAGGLLCTQGLNHFTDLNRTLNPYWGNSSRNVFLQSGNVLQLQGIFFAGASYFSSNRLEAYTYINSIILATLVSYGLKYSVNEIRPRGSPYGWPSGHTTAAASAFGVSLALKNPYQIALSFAGTLLTAYSRLLYYKKERAFHSLTQVLAGFVLGTMTGYIVGRNFSLRTKSYPVDKVSYSIRNTYEVSYFSYNYSLP